MFLEADVKKNKHENNDDLLYICFMIYHMKVCVSVVFASGNSLASDCNKRTKKSAAHVLFSEKKLES